MMMTSRASGKEFGWLIEEWLVAKPEGFVSGIARQV
jgi:hypothetical protein